MSSPERSFEAKPIGYLRTTANKRYEAPRQPGASDIHLPGRIVLNAGHNFEQALEDLDGFSKFWLIYWFDRNDNWKPKVLPPRGRPIKRGVFATRSPHRPNPIGLSLVDLLEIKGRTLYVANVDLLDKTPILDIKPYLPYADAFPDAKAGWIDEIEQQAFDVEWSSDIMLDVAECAQIESHLRIAIPMSLIVNPDDYPLPHPYRRIRRTAVGYEIALQTIRLTFEIEDSRVLITSIVANV